MSRQYIANIRAVFTADDDVLAQVIADQIRANAGQDLEFDEGDSVDVTEVMPLGFGMSRAEVIQVLEVARNVLIRTRVRQCYDLAREIDRTAWILEHRLEEMFDAGAYDAGRFMRITEEVLNKEDQSG